MTKTGSIAVIVIALVIIGFIGLYILPALVRPILAGSQAEMHVQKIDRVLAYSVHDVTVVSQPTVSNYHELQTGIAGANKKYAEIGELCEREPIWCSDSQGLPFRPPPDEIAKPFAVVYASYDNAKKLIIDERFDFQPRPSLERPSDFETYIDFNDSVYFIRVINPFSYDEWNEIREK